MDTECKDWVNNLGIDQNGQKNFSLGLRRAIIAARAAEDASAAAIAVKMKEDADFIKMATQNLRSSGWKFVADRLEQIAQRLEAGYVK